jgi:multiple sugar transport system permease protein
MTETVADSVQSQTQTMARPARQRLRLLFKTVWRVLDYGVMILLTFVFLCPLIFMVVSAFKPNTVIFQDVRSLNAFVPTVVTLDNFRTIFLRTNFGRFMFNSVFIATCTVLLSLFINSMAAFSLARLHWRGRYLVLSIIIALLIIPFEAIAIPLLVVVNKLVWPTITLTDGLQIMLQQSWLNTRHVQILPFVADAFSIFLFYQFFLGIPRELDESALIDGATPFGIYRNIIVPLSRPVFATVAILQFLARWNDYLWPVIAVQGEAARPLTVGIATFYTQTPDWGQILAYAAMITIPVLIVFLAFQRGFIRSIASTGLKG